jgi:hypothetical protein
MASDHLIRASDRDRDAVVATLRDAYTAGRLTLEEFDERTTAAYASKTWGELRRLTEDLPSQPILGADVPGRRTGMDVPGHLLPAHPPKTNQSGGSPQRHGRRRGALVPFLAVWVILMLAARSSGVLVPAALLMMIVVCMALARRH